MRQFSFIILILIICIIIIGIYSGAIGKFLKPHTNADKPDMSGAIDKAQIGNNTAAIKQKYTPEEIREAQRRLIEERKRRLQDFQRRH